MLSKKLFALGAFIGAVLMIAFVLTFPDGKLHIVFCNVGQGDATYIRTPDGRDMLIDGGPDDSVLSCLGRHMPFYDRTIDVAVLSHPQKDHMKGLLSVLERYHVSYAIVGVEAGVGEEYSRLLRLLAEKQSTVKNEFTGDTFLVGKVRFNVLWPDRKWVESKTQNSKLLPRRQAGKTQSSGVTIGNAVLGITTEEDVNDFSYFIHLSYGKFSTLFTGDGDVKIQPEILAEHVLSDVDILKVPHHGSKTGMLPDFLDAIKPELAVISVGKNSYGHPTREALQLLTDRLIKIARTDEKGDIEIVSDGTKWWY
jgi:competence protein ComEC